MNRSKLPANEQESCVVVSVDALDDLLEAIWHWAFEDYLTTPTTDRHDHIFHTIVRLDAVLHDLTVGECWERIKAWWQEQQGS